MVEIRQILFGQFDFKRSGVVADMRVRARLLNCDYVRLAQHPGERDLARCRAMGLRDFL